MREQRRQQFVEQRLVDRGTALTKHRETRGIDVKETDVDARVREADRSHKADVARTDHADWIRTTGPGERLPLWHRVKDTGRNPDRYAESGPSGRRGGEAPPGSVPRPASPTPAQQAATQP